jgi:hypothetical protein
MPKKIPVPADVAEAVHQRPARYPTLLLAEPFKNEADPAFEDFTAMVHLAAWDRGHGSCGGWHFSPASALIVCACGDVLFEVADPAAENGAAA